MQQIDTAQRSAVVLPLSGTGVLPAVSGTVTLGNNSTVCGLAIAVPDDGSADTRNPGIAGSNISNPTIRDNTISSSDGSGILLNGVSGQLEIANNTISNSLGDGIRVNKPDFFKKPSSSVRKTSPASRLQSLQVLPHSFKIILRV